MTEKTKVIIAAHLYGIPCDIDTITSLARENGSYVIEDCAQSLGAAFGGRKTGTFGDIAMFSFNYEKHMTTGQGGILAINNHDLIDAVEKTIATYRRVPLDPEKCFIYGMLLEHFALERPVHTRLTATFGEECFQRDRQLFEEMDRLVEGCHRGGGPGSLLPYLKKHIEALQ